MIGTIVNFDANMGDVLVDFPFGRLPLEMDPRDMAHLRAREPVVFDHNLRPGWSARPGAA